MCRFANCRGVEAITSKAAVVRFGAGSASFLANLSLETAPHLIFQNFCEPNRTEVQWSAGSTEVRTCPNLVKIKHLVKIK